MLLCSFLINAQNIQVDAQSYTAQQLIEDILIDSDCISNVVVTNVVGGNFNSTEKSYGYFNASGTTFPFSKGLVLSTGKLSNVKGPNTTLSDDDATNWIGDSDLEQVLNETNTINATSIEFEFTSAANQISFNYIFASEEYQQNNSNTCKYSDLFGFLIRPVSSTQYTNIALVPNTQTPVKVTTVHPLIPNGCAAINELYFDSWNGTIAPINFNGQTTVLTATASVIPNETYHVKLVIADEKNYRYDSAVFLEAGSFKMNTDLGEDRLIASNNPVCFNETLDLDATTLGTNVSYKWFKNGSEILGETNGIYTVKDAGIYSVEVSLNGTCVSNGEITIEYTGEISTTENYLGLCDNDTDGLTFFNLHLADPFYNLDMTGLTVVDFFKTEENASNYQDPIPNSDIYFNSVPNEVVYARIENSYGCYTVEKLNLNGNFSSSSIKELNVCDDDSDGFTTFNLDELRTLIKPEVSATANIYFFKSYNDAAYHQNILPDSFENTTTNTQQIWVKAKDIFCELLTTITLNVIAKPDLLNDETLFYCLNTYPETITLNAGLLNKNSNETYYYSWKKNGIDLGLNQEEIEINEGGTYSITVANSTNCFAERAILVNTSETAKIDDIIIETIGDESNISVIVSGTGEYEFSLDNGIFQTENTFFNVLSGNHNISVKDLNGCNLAQEEVSIYSIPKFFTPNNDFINDTWNPAGIGTAENPIVSIHIFNRFGKLITELNPNGNGWDGLVNGKQMPSTDYWFKIIFNDKQLLQGHFALIR